jgi:hypothetical protein
MVIKLIFAISVQEMAFHSTFGTNNPKAGNRTAAPQFS